MHAPRALVAARSSLSPTASRSTSGSACHRAPAWDGRETTSEAPAIAVPGLVVHDPDGDAEYAAARAAAQAAGAEFVEGRGGHGYEIVTRIQGGLTPLGERVVERALSGPAAG